MFVGRRMAKDSALAVTMLVTARHAMPERMRAASTRTGLSASVLEVLLSKMDFKTCFVSSFISKFPAMLSTQCAWIQELGRILFQYHSKRTVPLAMNWPQERHLDREVAAKPASARPNFFEKNEPPCVACISLSPSSKDSLTSSNFTFSLSTLRTSTSSFWAACEIGTMFSSSFGVSGRPSELLVSACRFSSSESELSQALAFFLSLVHAPNAFGCFRFCDFCGRDLADNPNGIGTGGFRAPVPFCGVVVTKKSELSSSATTNKREASSNEWLQSQCSTAISVNCADVDLKNSENKWCVVEIFGCPSSFFQITLCHRSLLRELLFAKEASWE